MAKKDTINALMKRDVSEEVGVMAVSTGENSDRSNPYCPQSSMQLRLFPSLSVR